MGYALVAILSLSAGYLISVFGHRKLWAKYMDAKLKLHKLRHHVVAIQKEFPREPYVGHSSCSGDSCDLMWDIDLN